MIRARIFEEKINLLRISVHTQAENVLATLMNCKIMLMFLPVETLDFHIRSPPFKTWIVFSIFDPSLPMLPLEYLKKLHPLAIDDVLNGRLLSVR